MKGKFVAPPSWRLSGERLKTPLLGKGGVAAVSADGVVRFFPITDERYNSPSLPK
jgi:hypothetical protein